MLSQSHCLFKDLLSMCPKDSNVVGISEHCMWYVVISSKACVCARCKACKV